MKHKLFIILPLVFAALIFAFIGCGGGGGNGTTPPDDGNGGNGGDTTAPTVQTLFPADEATGVSLNTNLIITFDEAVTIGTGNISIYDSSDDSLLGGAAIDVASAQVTAVGSDTFVIDHPTDFTSPNSYYVQIDAGAFKDAANNNFAGITDKETWDFTADGASDGVAPSYTDLFPADGATNIALNVNLVITFDELVIPGTGTINIYDADAGPLLFEAIDATSAQVTGYGTDTLTIDPSSDFSATTNYYVLIDSGAIKDMANQDFPGITLDTEWNFQTGLTTDSTPPSISVLSPLDDATDVLPTANLVITFTEPVFVDAGNITIYDSTDTLFEAIDVASVLVTGSGTDTITINPTDDFTELTNYYVLVDPGAFKDGANYDFAGITSSASWNFGVRDNTPPAISTVYPADGATAVPTNTNLIIVFSEAVDVDTGAIYIYDNDNVLKDTIDVEADIDKISGVGTNTIVIDRDNLTYLSASLNHYVQIDAGAFVDIPIIGPANSFEGILAPDTTTWNFQTVGGADITDPLISSRIPSIGAINVPLNTNLQITFDEVVFIDSGNIEIYEVGYGLRESIDVTSSKVTGSWTDTISIDTADFPTPMMFYWVQISETAFYDISGNYFAGITDASWNFMTGSGADTSPPSISTISPADDATDVVLVSDLEITFDEVVNAGSGNISIYKSGDPDTLIEQIDVGSAQVTGLGTANITVAPANEFDASTDYYIQIDSTAFKDVANNYFTGISDTTSWSFTTEIGELLTDSFDYGVTSANLDGSTTGSIPHPIDNPPDTEFTSPWDAVGTITDTVVQYDNTTGLNKTNYSTGSGGSATAQNDTNGGGMEQGFTAGAVTDDGVMYFGFIVNRLTTTDNPDTGPGILFYNGTTALGGVSFTARNNPSAKYNVTLDGGGVSTAALMNNASNGTAYLIIIRYDFTNDTLYGWVDPDVSAAEPAPDATLDLSGSPWANIDNVAIDQNWRGIAPPTNTYRIDEIKVTKSWGLLAE
ncbi:MAG: Ig-like domain-containing protein [Spirochaetota bacterium]|nr:MAG: Ig-like domain-containing protein [Spirochaetota bacterium]